MHKPLGLFWHAAWGGVFVVAAHQPRASAFELDLQLGYQHITQSVDDGLVWEGGHLELGEGRVRVANLARRGRHELSFAMWGGGGSTVAWREDPVQSELAGADTATGDQQHRAERHYGDGELSIGWQLTGARWQIRNSASAGESYDAMPLIRRRASAQYQSIGLTDEDRKRAVRVHMASSARFDWTKRTTMAAEIQTSIERRSYDDRMTQGALQIAHDVADTWQVGGSVASQRRSESGLVTVVGGPRLQLTRRFGSQASDVTWQLGASKVRQAEFVEDVWLGSMALQHSDAAWTSRLLFERGVDAREGRGRGLSVFDAGRVQGGLVILNNSELALELELQRLEALVRTERAFMRTAEQRVACTYQYGFGRRAPRSEDIFAHRLSLSMAHEILQLTKRAEFDRTVLQLAYKGAW